MEKKDKRFLDALVLKPVRSLAFSAAFHEYLIRYFACLREEAEAPVDQFVLGAEEALRVRFRDEAGLRELMRAVGPCAVIQSLNAMEIGDEPGMNEVLKGVDDRPLHNVMREHVGTCRICARELAVRREIDHSLQVSVELWPSLYPESKN